MELFIAFIIIVIGMIVGAYSASKDCDYCGFHGASRWTHPVCPRCGRNQGRL